MLFCSEEFIFIFLPVFLLVYYILPGRWRNGILLAGSLWFYYQGERYWFILIVISVVLNYLGTTLMQGKKRAGRKRILVFLLCYDFGCLFIFKYLPFLIGEVNKLVIGINEKRPDFGLSLPLGISFYTFQIAAYAIDVYRHPKEYERNIISVGTYICMFPQLIAGPIVLFRDVAQEMRKRCLNLAGLEQGFMLFTAGLGYKMLIANPLGLLWNEIRVAGVESISTSMAWLGALAFSFQLYFDFNGYSLMAAGLGSMLGFRIPRNFRHPYTAVSVTDFWRRWHITLSTWFREYLYIPLGGNRRGMARTVWNLLVVWTLTGIWHGAGWNFLLWGLYYFLLLAVEKIVTGNFWKHHHGLGRIYTMTAVVTGWVIFSLEDLKSIGIYLKKMFFWIGQEDAWVMHFQVTVSALKRYGIFLAAAVLLSTYLPDNLYRQNRKKGWFLLAMLGVFWASVYQMITAAGNPFLYFRF